MTRETKIGLLIGLGFIVVFAVLLSHTGTTGPAGGGLALGPRTIVMPGKVPQSAPHLANPPYVPADQVRPGRPIVSEASAAPTSRPAGRVGLGETPNTTNSFRSTDNHPASENKVAELPLPEPKSLTRNRLAGGEPAPGAGSTAWERALATVARSEGEVSLAANSPGSNLPAGRVAPQRQEMITAVPAPRVEPPQPAARPETPTATPTPEAKLAGAPTDKAKTAPPDRREVSKEYVVQKGDTVRKIIKENYGVASTKVVEFFVASNKSRIKDKDTIVEGQKLVVPPLPPEMFEAAPNFDVSGVGEGARTVTSEELTLATAPRSGKDRVAPTELKKVLASNEPTTAPAEKMQRLADRGGRAGYRTYEIQSSETLRSIAARELGSANHWNEIRKLNPVLDPKKLKPGMKIRVPAKRPLTSVGGARQVSA